MNYSVHETRDNRYFKYGVQIFGGMLNFHEARTWFTQTYGIGDDIARDEPLVNGHWAFFIKFQHYVIYIEGDEELSWFKMKYGDPS